MTAARQESGPIVAALAALLGARIGEGQLRGLPFLGPAAVLTLAIGTALAPPGRRARRLVGLACLAGIAAGAMARAVSGLDGVPARLAATAEERRVRVRLVADPERRWAQVAVPVRLEQIEGAPGREAGERRASGTVLVMGSGAAAGRLQLLEAGEEAALVGRFRPLGAGEEHWRWRHIGAVFEARDLVGAGRAAPAILRLANGLRHRVLAGGDGLDRTDRALVAGFLVGDDRDLPPAVARDFRAAGLSHLLVVSGANVTLALALVAPFLRRLGLGGRMAGGLSALIVFCAMTRFEPSVLRAAVMAGLALLAAFVGRPVPGLRLLALTVTGLVLIDPFLVHSLGFGLSCGASAGILLLAGPLGRSFPGPRMVRDPLAVTLAAQIGVAPIALPVFGHLPLAALPANLAAAPAAAALSLWGLGSGLIGGLIGGGGGGLLALQVPTTVLAGWIRLVAHIAARSPLMVGPRVVLAGAVGAGLWCLRPGRGRRPATGAGR